MKFLINTLFFSLLFLPFKAQPLSQTTRDTCAVPTIFTPNDDGVNDQLVIPCVTPNDKTNDSELYILTEWGEQILHARPYKNEWPGDYKGQPLPDGTYFYIFILHPSLPAQRGYVTIFR